MKISKPIFIILIITVSYSCHKTPQNGTDIIKLMKSKYQNSWYQNFTFSQHVNHYQNDSVISKEIWHEAYSYPNKLIIKFNDFQSGNGVLFKNDTLYVFVENQLVNKQKRIHDLILLGFDIYELPLEESLTKLKDQGYDLSKMYTTKINNRETYCIGAKDDNDKSNRFFIDKENLYFVKNIKYSEKDISETIFSNYQIIEGNYVATKIIFLKNNKVVMDEEYYNIKFPKKLNESIFDINNFKNAIW